jgi:antitoxin HicB
MWCSLPGRKNDVTDLRATYKVVIEPLSAEDGGGFLATVPELPGCMSDGETRAEALTNVEDAIATWIYCARKMGQAIPEPQLHRAA